jgi:NAD(P)H-dependent nitrite reductase small subunit
MKNMEDYSFICYEDKLNESEGQRFYINDTDVALFKVDGKIYAVSNVCPHQQASKIYEGFVENSSVVCPLHGWTFKLSDGKLHSGSRGLDAYPVKIVNGKIYAKVVAKKLNW